MSSHIFARKLSVQDINEILIKIQSLSISELRDTVKICAADIKNDIKVINKVYDDIDRVNKRYRNTLAERRYLLERCHVLGAEINSLRHKLDRGTMCKYCKKCCV